MPSKLRLELDFTVLPPIPTKLHTSSPAFTKRPSPLGSSPLPTKSSKMSLTQTYRIASCARNKLGSEALKPDHNLRLLVGHANLLDSLMLDLAQAERQQEAWFNSTVRRSSAAKPSSAPKHIQWMDTVAEAEETLTTTTDDDSDDDYETLSEDGDLSDDEDDLLLDADNFPIVSMASRQRRSVSPPPFKTIQDEDVEVDIVDDEADDEHALVRVASRSSSISSSTEETPDSEVPALEYELESDEDSPLPSPAKETFAFFPPATKKARTEQISAASDLIRDHLAQGTVIVSA